ncbi:MAG: penicillin acylase family protein, partial [Calditrichia bacterium]
MQKKIVLGIAVALFIFVAGMGTFVYLQIDKMLPHYKGSLKVEGIHNPVRIQWDDYGVIHIAGESTDDVIFASGFAAAKERLWQMEMARRFGKGELSEVFGDTTLKMDELSLTLGLDSLTIEIYKSISKESQAWLQDYATGINAYIKSHKKNLPPEFIMMGIRPEKWTPQDCLLQNRIMAWFLNFNWKADYLYWQLYSKLSRDRFNEIWPKWANYPDIIKSTDSGRMISELMQLDSETRRFLQMPAGSWGSNNWVISPKRSRNGYAMLANDPHLSLQLPSLWIEMELRSPDFDVAGFSFPGSPGIIIGRNRHIAWGVTNGMIDDCDYFLEEVDTLDHTYVMDRQKRPLKIQNHLIKVKKQPDEYFTVMRTSHGPLFRGLFPEMKSSQFLSLKWEGEEKSDELLTFIRLADAENWDDFTEALSTYAIPAQNFVYADADGNIGYRLGGKIPIRSYKIGLLPVRGNTSKNNWNSYIPPDKMPEIYNPSRGWIATANNRIIGKYPYYLSELWEPPYRVNRIEQMISGSPLVDKEDMRKFQYDTVDLLAEETMPIILPELRSMQNRSKTEDDLLMLLEGWKYKMDSKSVAPAVYQVMQYMLIKNIFKDAMGENLFKVFTGLPNFYLRVFAQVFENNNSAWFVDSNSSDPRNRGSLIRESFKEAIVYLQDSVSVNMENWNWGHLHSLELRHILGQVPLTRKILNKGPFPAPGSGTTVNVGAYQYSEPYGMVVGASLRFLVDWGETDTYHS